MQGEVSCQAVVAQQLGPAKGIPSHHETSLHLRRPGQLLVS